MILKHLKCVAILAALLITVPGLAGCGTSAKSENTSVANSSSLFTSLVEYSSEDTDASWQEANATKIALNDSSAEIDGSGASVANNTITINAAGTYILSGTLSDGQIVVSAGEKDKVHLVLNEAALAYSNNAPLYIKQADKTIITLAAGTTNSVTDGSAYNGTSEEDEPDAAIFSKTDLTINGTGTLIVNGNYNNGIGTKDDLVITGGTINVTAANDGLRGRDSVAIKDVNLTISAKSDGIQSNNDEDADKGWISLDGGIFNITAGQDGIQAQTILQINGGNFILNTGGGASASNKIHNDFPGGGMNNTTAAEEETESAKALKGGTGIGISNGVLTIDSADDAIHSNGDVAIKGGTFDITTGDDAVHADNQVTIDGGTIQAAKSYEGIEGAFITINGGNIRLITSDDGLNAAGGNDGSGQQQGGDKFSSAGNYEVKITGGYIYLDSSGDGLDSNGDLNIDGGTIIVNGPTNNGNGPLDYNGTSNITGGILVAVGSSGMAQAPEDSSSQNSLMVYYSAAQEAGTLVNLSDETGKSLLTFAPAKTYQSIVISTPELQQGKSYTISSGGSCNGKNMDGLFEGGTYTSGTKLTNVTLSGAVTRISDDGSEVTGRDTMGGGRGGQPGMEGQRRQPGMDGQRKQPGADTNAGGSQTGDSLG